MFDFIRNHTRLTLGFLLLLIIPSFIFFGVEGYSKLTDGTGTAVAKVDGRAITRPSGTRCTSATSTASAARCPTSTCACSTRPRCARTRWTAWCASACCSPRQQTAPDPERCAPAAPFRQRPAVRFHAQPRRQRQPRHPGRARHELRDVRAAVAAGVRHAAGAGGRDAHRRGPAQCGHTVAGRAAAAARDPVPALRRGGLPRQGQPHDAEIEAFYKAQEAQFKAPEQASIEYVVLDLDTLAKGLTPSDEDLRKYYEDNARASPR
jgi:peptidyl-prolyl cis-trans isomerase D